MRRVDFLLVMTASIGFAPRARADADAEQAKTVIVVRHAEAEPAPAGGDPGLSPGGRARAVELARTLADASVRTVLSTHYARNRQTIEPLVRGTGGRVKIVDEVPAIVAAVAAEPWGSTVVVVGHSNTMAKLLTGLAGRAFSDVDPVPFDAMWIVTLSRGGASWVRLRYGPATAR
jgi:broad specificity phosphatase PhoE